MNFEIDVNNEGEIKRTLQSNIFSRNKKLFYLLNTIVDLSTHECFAINGDWGSGKTVFVKQLEYLIKHRVDYKSSFNELTISAGIPNIIDLSQLDVFYYNAWENDFLGNPVLSLMYQMVDAFNFKEIKVEEKVINKVETLNSLVKLLSGGLVELPKVETRDLLKNVKDAEYINKKFNEIIDNILAESNTKIVIIIDELDRCKPTYAVHLLESIKHFYNNDKIQFVIATNNVQLSKTIKKLYGSEYDADLYLQRFFTHSIELTVSNIDRYITEELKYQLGNMGLKGKVIKSCIDYFKLSVREINKYIKLLDLHSYYINTLDEMYTDRKCQHLISTFIIPVGLAIKCKNASTFNEFLNGDWDNIEEFINRNVKLKKELCRLYPKGSEEEAEKYIIDSIKEIYRNLFVKDVDRFDEEEIVPHEIITITLDILEF